MQTCQNRQTLAVCYSWFLHVKSTHRSIFAHRIFNIIYRLYFLQKTNHYNHYKLFTTHMPVTRSHMPATAILSFQAFLAFLANLFTILLGSFATSSSNSTHWTFFGIEHDNPGTLWSFKCSLSILARLLTIYAGMFDKSIFSRCNVSNVFNPLHVRLSNNPSTSPVMFSKGRL